MKSNNEDKVLMEKLGSLDTLSGGIVYGREEAWEKLQGRLDAKPAKRIVLKYGMAAALIILLGLMGLYFYPTKEQVNTKTQLTNITANQPVVPTAALPQPETTMAYTSVKNNRRETKKRNAQPAVCHTSKVLHPLVAEASEALAAKEVAIPPVTQPTVPKPLPVVCINDLENESPLQDIKSITVAGNAPLDFNKMPVLYIDDVVKNEDEIKSLLKENRMSFGHSLRARRIPADDNYSVDAGDDIPKHNLIKNIFNTQN